MRLHLPKGLLHAVLTALVTTSAALVTLGSSAHAGISGSTFYLNGSSADVEGDNATYCTWDSGSVYTSISTDPEGVSAVIGTIAAGEISTATINTLYLPNEKALTISAGGDRGFTEGDGLIIKDVQIAGDNGTATMTIAASQIVTLGAVSGGKLNVEFTTGGDNYNRKLQIKDSSTISLGTIKNSWGLDAINIEAGSQLSADTISFKTGNNDRGDGQGGKITGGGTVKVTTFETGNVGNYTVNVNKFEATAINAACASDRTLTLSSTNLTVGTLTQTQGKVVLNSANASIESLVLSGGVFSNNGTLALGGTDKTISLSTSIENTGTLSIEAVSTVLLKSGIFSLEGVKTTENVPVSGNGFSTFEASVNISSIFTGNTATIGDNVTWRSDVGELVFDQDSGLLSGDIGIAFGYYYLNDSSSAYDFSSATKLFIGRDAGVVALSSSMPSDLNEVTINKGATLDLNSQKDQDFRVVLNGGVLANNSGDGIGKNSRQVDSITLTADSEVSAVKSHGILASGYGTTSLSLGSNTLTKTGEADFYACNTSVTGTGTLKIVSGAFDLYGNGNNASNTKLGDGVTVELAGGSLKGTFANDGSSTIYASQDGTVSATITNNGTLKVTSAEDKTVSFTGAIKSGADNASLVIEGTAKLTAKLNTETVKNISVSNGGYLILDGGNANGDYAGTITVAAGGKMLATNNGNYNIVNGGNGKFVLDGEFAIESTGVNNVNGISGSGIVKTAQNATLNIVCESVSTLDESGTTTPTSYTSTFSGSVEASGSEKTVTLAFTGPSDATDDSPGSSGTTISLKSLSATNGSTLNAKGIAAVTDTTGGLSVSELVIGAGSKVQVWGTGNTWTESTEATVLMKGSDVSPVTLTVGTGTGTGASTLNANLVLDGATVTLNNALAMGSSLTLNDITLSMSGLLGGHIASGDTIELFTGVDSLTLGTGTASGDAITVGAKVDASDYFTNLGQGDFLLTYTGGAEGSGGIVALVAQRDVPEPTTATLSLLALMGLAARRRRRKA